MDISIAALAILTWLAMGASSFIYWWTKDFDLDTDDLPMTVLAAFMGPIAFLVGYTVHGDHRRERSGHPLVRRRGSRS